MARNQLPKALEELDRVFATTLFNGPKAAAERVVRDLQQAGPSWTGKFSNSWQIETPTNIVKGDGQPGEPRPLSTPAVSGRQVTRSFLSQDKVVFRISNYSPYAAEATDEVQSTFERPKNAPIPQTQLGLRKWDEQDTTRLRNTYRGQTTGGRPGGSASRTAPLDWLTNYADGGALNKAVKIEMDAALRNPR
jgi:hypothetical protein